MFNRLQRELAVIGPEIFGGRCEMGQRTNAVFLLELQAAQPVLGLGDFGAAAGHFFVQQQNDGQLP